ncbi:MAG: hypothetical protein B6245_04860, partial [Desulfobacteraceae bacterium 4572_88]
ESCRPQGVRRTPEAWCGIVMSIKADGDVFNVTEAETEESSVPLRSLTQRRTGGIPEGLPVSSGRGMCEERHTGTRETPEVPDGEG